MIDEKHLNGTTGESKSYTITNKGLLHPTPNCVEYYQVVKSTADEVVQRIYEAMSDYVQVVRCKDCKYQNTVMCPMFVLAREYGVEINDQEYCSRGERREDAETD